MFKLIVECPENENFGCMLQYHPNYICSHVSALNLAVIGADCHIAKFRMKQALES